MHVLSSRSLPWAIAGLLLGALALALPRAAEAVPKGQIVLLKGELGPISSDADLQKQMKKLKVSQPPREGDGWDMQFIAFLKQPAWADTITLVVYAGKDAKEYVNVYDISTRKGTTTVQAKVRMFDSDGLKSGKPYTFRVARKDGGKEVVYAQTVVTLP